MGSYTIFIFEGEVTEVKIFSRLKELFLSSNPNQIAICSFRTHLYTLHKRLEDDPDRSLFSLLKENSKNVELKNVLESQVAEIYMFFDYDGHVPGATFEKIEALLDFFNEETDQGKLYISYPMVESLKHTKSQQEFKDVVASSSRAYKKISGDNCGTNEHTYSQYSKIQWAELIELHGQKLNYIMKGSFSPPLEYFPQLNIYEQQKTKHINPTNKVSVLSAFPVFLLDYFGVSEYTKLTSKEQ